MITFSKFGLKGGLGNQLFQFASLVGIANRRNFEWALPTQLDSGKSIDLLELFSVPDIWKSSNSAASFDLPKFRSRPNRFCDTTGVKYDKKLHNKIPDNHDIDAYLQSEKYFLDSSEYLRSQLTIKKEVSNYSPTSTEKYIAVHIRRQDYLKAKHTHSILPLSYYESALNLLPESPIVVFSDDPNWVKEQAIFQTEAVTLMQGDAFADFQGIMGATYTVIANSSFSWWAAWLSDAEVVIAPKRWFGWSYPKSAAVDIIPERWISL
jgi:hypothetical protein